MKEIYVFLVLLGIIALLQILRLIFDWISKEPPQLPNDETKIEQYPNYIISVDGNKRICTKEITYFIKYSYDEKCNIIKNTTSFVKYKNLYFNIKPQKGFLYKVIDKNSCIKCYMSQDGQLVQY